MAQLDKKGSTGVFWVSAPRSTMQSHLSHPVSDTSRAQGRLHVSRKARGMPRPWGPSRKGVHVTEKSQVPDPLREEEKEP